MKSRPARRLSRWPRSRHWAAWGKAHPALPIALRFAQRFLKWEGVVGLGVGKKLRGRSLRIVRPAGAPGGLCIQVFVTRKVSAAQIRRLGGEVLPKTIPVRLPGRKTPVRVPVDVLSASPYEAPSGGIQLESGRLRSLTVVGTTNVGRLFGIFPRPGGNPASGLEAGTVGAFVRESTAQCHAVSAGHVFIPTSTPPWRIPTGDRTLHIANGVRTPLPRNQFVTRELGLPPDLLDAVVFRVPPPLDPAPPACSWPAEFDGELATATDTVRVGAEDREGSWLWVQRERQLDPHGANAREPFRLEVNLIGLTPQPFERVVLATGRRIRYPEVWYYRYPLATLADADAENPWRVSVGGDSGAGLYVPAADGSDHYRLLGFHIYRERQNGDGPWIGYAVPAEQFLRQALEGRHRENWWFYGKE
ncbi:MAG: hypothetical protein HS113_23335 [Verrucomicrobiales bacterium]|nr:hypothetical protein [Verrucomicrobiales bacterium]